MAAPGDAEWQMPARRFYADWRERNWGEITEQDYENLGRRAARHAVVGLDGVAARTRARRATSCTCTA